MGLSQPPTLLHAKGWKPFSPTPVIWVEPHTAPSNAKLPQAPEDGLCDTRRSRVPVPTSLHESLQRPGKTVRTGRLSELFPYP